jgi:hypothetical protein
LQQKFRELRADARRGSRAVRSTLHHFVNVSAAGGATSPIDQPPLVGGLPVAESGSFEFP